MAQIQAEGFYFERQKAPKENYWSELRDKVEKKLCVIAFKGRWLLVSTLVCLWTGKASQIKSEL